MPLIVLAVIALVSGVLVALLARRLQPVAAVAGVASTVAVKGGRAAARHPRLRAFVDTRTDRTVAGGLALTLALLVIIAAGVVVGGLALLLHGNPKLTGLDDQIMRWANRHATSASTHGLDVVTHLGATVVVVPLAITVAVAEFVRRRNALVFPFMTAVMVGELVLSSSIKSLVDRVRPTLNPIAHTLGPSFPSGHTTAAAAFYAAAAVLMSRGRGPSARAALAGAAAGIAVAVAASRVLLGVHFLTDVIGGLALGWGWTAICVIAFGTRILR